MRRLLVLFTMSAMVVVAAACATPQTNSPGSADPTGSDVTTPPDATGTLDTTEIPVSALLTGEDVGSGYTAEPNEPLTDHGSIAMMMSYCGEGDYSEAGEYVVAQIAGSVHRQPVQEDYLLATISRYEAGWAERHLSDLIAVLPQCTEVAIGGNPNDVAMLTVVDTNFAGDGSVLLREVRGPATGYHAVVRQGDLESVMRMHIPATDTQAREIVIAAAERLCAAEPAC